jgi:N-acetylmuramoyl-L-alanine amidase
MKIACVAQAILESGRGTSRVSRECKNFWGMKMRPELESLAVGKRVEVTSEDEGFAVFAAFESVGNAIKGWLKFLTRSYYAGWEEHKDNAYEFIRHIGKSWCPRADYADEVIKLIPEARRLLNIPAPEDKEPTDSKPADGKVFKIFLDPGHSIRRTGARSSDGTAKEEALNVLQCNIIKRELEATGKFLCTIYNPENDDLTDVGSQAKGHDMSLHVHHNSHDGGNTDPGTEVLYDNDKAEAQSKEFAAKLSAAIAKALGTKDRGAKPFAGTVMDVAERQGTFPVVLSESYFLNPYDKAEAEVRSATAAMAMVGAIKEWFKV